MYASVDDAGWFVAYAEQDAVVLLVLVRIVAWADTAIACTSRAVGSVGREVIKGYVCSHRSRVGCVLSGVR